MPFSTGPVRLANKSPGLGVPLGLGLGLGLPVGVALGLGLGKTVGDGLGVPFGVALGLALGLGLGKTVGDGLGEPPGVPLGLAVGLALGLGKGDPDGEGVGVTEPNVPARMTFPLASVSRMGVPTVTAGTGWPSFVSRLKKIVPNWLTVVVWLSAPLLTITVRTVPAGRLIDEPSTSRRRRPSSS